MHKDLGYVVKKKGDFFKQTNDLSHFDLCDFVKLKYQNIVFKIFIHLICSFTTENRIELEIENKKKNIRNTLKRWAVLWMR